MVTVNKCVPEVQTKTRTYTVNTMVPKTKMVPYKVAVPYTEQVEQSYTVCTPYTEQVVQNYTVMEPSYSTVQQSYTVCTPYTEQVSQNYVVCTPYTEQVAQNYTVMESSQVQKTGTKMVCQTYNETLTRTVTKDMGSWQCQTMEVPVSSCGSCGGRTGILARLMSCRSRCASACVSSCGDCSSCGGCDAGCGTTMTTVQKRVWVPNVVTEEVPCTVTRSKMVPQEYNYMVTVCTPVTKTRMVNVTKYKRTKPRLVWLTSVSTKNETKTREVKVCKNAGCNQATYLQRNQVQERNQDSYG